MSTIEEQLRTSFRNGLEAHCAIAAIAERVLLVEAARKALLEDPASAEKEFSPFILSIARAPEAEWLHDCFIRTKTEG
jgi:hypothetical protein